MKTNLSFANQIVENSNLVLVFQNPLSFAIECAIGNEILINLHLDELILLPPLLYTSIIVTSLELLNLSTCFLLLLFYFIFFRLEFFQTWIDKGEPNVYWLSGFYFTQSFMTGVLQNYSRKNRFQIDMVRIEFEVTKHEMEADETPDLGAYIMVRENKKTKKNCFKLEVSSLT